MKRADSPYERQQHNVIVPHENDSGHRRQHHLQNQCKYYHHQAIAITRPSQPPARDRFGKVYRPCIRKARVQTHPWAPCFSPSPGRQSSCHHHHHHNHHHSLHLRHHQHHHMTMRSMLGMPPNTSIHSVIMTMHQLLKHQRR